MIDYVCFGLHRNVLTRLLGHVGAQLERLEIKIEYESNTYWPPCIHEILQHCPQLQHLTYNADFSNDIMIQDFEAADDEPQHQQRAKYPLLQTLQLEREDFQTSKLLPFLRACPHLRRLHLSSALVCNVDLLLVFDTCPALQSLEIDVKHDTREMDKLYWWKAAWTHHPLHDGNVASHGLSHLIVTNLCRTHQLYALNTIVNQHYQTLKHIEVAISNDLDTHHTGSKHEAICNAPPHLEKLDYHFGRHQYMDDDLEFLIRPHLEQCLQLTWVSIKADTGNHHHPILPRWAFEALAQLSDLRHLCIQIPNDPNDMIYFLNTIKKRKRMVLTSLLYQGLWLSNIKVIRAIVAIPSLQCLALSVPSMHEHVPRNEMLETLQLLQGAPCLQSLAFTNVNGFGPHRVWKEIRDMPHLEQLYIVTYAVTSKKGIRHLANRQPPLKALVIMESSDDCYHRERDNDLLQTLEYARTKIKIVRGEHDCGKCCQPRTNKEARMYGL